MKQKEFLKKGLMLDNNNITLLNSLGKIYHEQRDSKMQRNIY